MSGNEYGVRQPDIRQLDNGATLCFVDVPYARTVHVGIEFPRAGDMYSPPGKRETAHLGEHMALAGADAIVDGQPLRSQRDFRLGLELNGAFANATTHPDRMHYALTSPVRGYPRALACLLAAVERPLFAPQELTSEREVVRGELGGYLDNAGRVVWHALMRRIGRPDRDLSRAAAGLDSIGTDDLREHHGRTHRTEGMLVVVTGPQSQLHTGLITEQFKKIRLEAAAPEPKPAPEIVQPETPLLIEGGRETIFYTLGKFGINQYPRDLGALSYIAEGALFHSPDALIYEGARDSGLVYGISGDLSGDWFSTQLFQVVGEVAPEKASALWRLVQRQMGRLLHGITAVEFEEIRENKLGKLGMQHDTPAATHALAFGGLRKYGQVESPDELIARVGGVTYKEYRANVHRLFAGGVAAVGAMGTNIQGQPELVAALQETQDFFRTI